MPSVRSSKEARVRSPKEAKRINLEMEIEIIVNQVINYINLMVERLQPLTPSINEKKMFVGIFLTKMKEDRNKNSLDFLRTIIDVAKDEARSAVIPTFLPGGGSRKKRKTRKASKVSKKTKPSKKKTKASRKQKKSKTRRKNRK